ncbi:unnamed protein product [Urochloa decumbens]|uniref:Uncharacterized protein n=1 Tax=Urochloa decumbens TaxID=240449 RepID=A0ABC8ZCU2_9POAL
MSAAAAAAAATPSSGTSTMKLLVDKASQRVLFAEAGKDVVDFLFGILTMPLCAAASLLAAGDAGASPADVLGSFANVYASAENMDAAYMQCPEARDALIVNNALPSGPSTRLLPTTTTTAAAAAYAAATATNTMAPSYNPYVWPSSAPGMPPNMPQGCPCQTYAPPPYHPTPAPAAHESASAVELLPAPDAGLALLPPALYRCHACHALGSIQGSTGFVQAVASYTVMDDLIVKPASNVSTVALLGTLGVKDLEGLEERTVTVGRKECLEILKVGLKSKTVLTDVFLPKTTKKRARTAGDKNDDNDGSSSK